MMRLQSGALVSVTITLRRHQGAAPDAVESALSQGVRRPLMDAARVRELLDYDKETGVFRWCQRFPSDTRTNKIWNTRYAGKIAGTETHHGYRQIRIGKRHLYEHRLAWLYVTGEWPPNGIDHKEGKSNAFSNLRVATQTQNNGNRRRDFDQKTPKGVSVHRCTGKWQARIKVNGKTFWLGCYEDINQAAEAYAQAARQYFGEFARVE